MPTQKKAELPEEMTTPLEAQESQTEENITCLLYTSCLSSLRRPKRNRK